MEFAALLTNYNTCSSMRTRPIVNINEFEIKLIEKRHIQVLIKIFAVIMITIQK